MSEGRLQRSVPRVVAAMSTTRAIAAAVGLVIVWALCGPLLQFSSAWQLAINTTTTIVTFLVGFCILYTTSKESKATQVKLDAILAALDDADDKIVGLEDQTEDVIDEIKAEVRSAADCEAT